MLTLPVVKLSSGHLKMPVKVLGKENGRRKAFIYVRDILIITLNIRLPYREIW